jgi:hypothetical protein
MTITGQVSQAPRLSYGDYFTAIQSFEYTRTRPGDQVKTVKPTYYTLPLPIQFPVDHYSSVTSHDNLDIAGNMLETVMNWNGSDVRDRRVFAAIGAAAAGTLAYNLFTSLRKVSNKTSGGSEISLGGKIQNGVLNAIGSGATAVAIGNRVEPYLGAFGGVVKNPKTVLLFNGMNLRTFSFVFRVSPRNAAESNLLNTYIGSIRNDMHPTYNSTLNSFALDYPRLFTVGYDNKLQNTQGYPKVGPSFLTDFQVNASPSGVAFYRDGNPTIVDLQMTFAEIDMATRETYAGGFQRDTNTPTINIPHGGQDD